MRLPSTNMISEIQCRPYINSRALPSLALSRATDRKFIHQGIPLLLFPPHAWTSRLIRDPRWCKILRMGKNRHKNRILLLRSARTISPSFSEVYYLQSRMVLRLNRIRLPNVPNGCFRKYDIVASEVSLTLHVAIAAVSQSRRVQSLIRSRATRRISQSARAHNPNHNTSTPPIQKSRQAHCYSYQTLCRIWRVPCYYGL